MNICEYIYIYITGIHIDLEKPSWTNIWFEQIIIRIAGRTWCFRWGTSRQGGQCKKAKVQGIVGSTSRCHQRDIQRGTILDKDTFISTYTMICIYIYREIDREIETANITIN